jgi:uncharacterized membrane protein required for colicin V production
MLLTSAGIGWYRGGLRELVVLAAIGAGFLAIHLFGPSASLLVDGTLARLLVLAGIFLATDILVVTAGSYAIRRYMNGAKTRNDRAAGALFGLVRGWVLAAFVVFTIEVYHVDTAMPRHVSRSLLAAPLSATADALLQKADVTQSRTVQTLKPSHVFTA